MSAGRTPHSEFADTTWRNGLFSREEYERMIQAALITAWFLVAGHAAAVEPSVTEYREAPPVIEAVRARPEPPIAEDRSFRLKRRAVDGLLAGTGVAALSLVVWKWGRVRRRASRHRIAGQSPHPVANPVPERPVTTMEAVRILRARRAAHAVEIERLLKRM